MVFSKMLIDTDVLIDFLRKKTAAKLLLEKVSENNPLYVSTITLAEILAGMKPSETEQTEALLQSLILIPVTEKIARRAGKLRHKSSQKILLPDCLIAATALEEDCGLLTFNQKDYPFQELNLYPIDNL